MTITTGVPQGSILGPLLFIMYMNDLSQSLSYSNVNMYADDTAIYVSCSNISILTLRLQTDLISVSQWLDINKLSLHVGKTSSMLVCSRQKRSHLTNGLMLSLQGSDILQTDSCKYLGVDIDQNLTFDNHVNSIMCKIRRSLGVLKRTCQYIPLQSRITMYNTIVLPHFDYCSTVWDTCSDSHISKLQVLQNRGMRLILGCDRHTHISDMLSRLKWLNVRQRLFLTKGVFMYKIINKITPDYMSNVCTSLPHNHFTRSQTSNQYRLISHQKSLSTRGVQIWNSLPHTIKQQPSLSLFKTNCTKYILGSPNIM